MIGLWIAGQSIGFFPRGAPRLGARSLHITVGAVLGVVLLIQLLRRQTGSTKLPVANAGMLGRAAQHMHHLLYALLIAVAIIGVGCVWIRGDSIFNWFAVPTFDPGNKWLRHKSVELHSLLGDLLLVVAGIHSIAAAWHLWQLKDDVLRRMLPRLAVRGRQRRA